MRYAASTNGFYPEDIEYPSLPDDIVDIDISLWEEMFKGQNNGLVITPGEDGRPYLAERPAPTKEQLADINESRKNSLIDSATQKIVVWQTKLLMGRKLTDAETKSLNAWIDYIDSLYSVDTSSGEDIEWPSEP